MYDTKYILRGETLASDTNLYMVRGDSMSFGFEYDGTTQNLNTAFFTCRNSESSEQVVFQKALGNGISKLDTGKYVIRVAPSDTRNIQAGVYYYDFQVSMGSDVFTLLKGALVIEQDTTY